MVTGVFKKKAEPQNSRPKRIQSMSDTELRSWLNACMMELGATYDRWQFHRGEAEEVTRVIGIVSDLWEEIQSRP